MHCFSPLLLHLLYIFAGIKQFHHWHLHEKIYTGMRCTGRCNGEFAEVFCSANYSKKDAAFTVLRTLAASFSGILVKNSMGLPVARAASAQEYTKKFFMFAE